MPSSVYDRYRISWANLPTPPTPSSHSNEMELYCAKLSHAVYSLEQNARHDPAKDFVPSRTHREPDASTRDFYFWIDGADIPSSPQYESPEGIIPIIGDRASAVLVWRHNHLAIAFRGSSSWQDWIHNFNAKRVPPPTTFRQYDCQLHKGFYGLANNLFPSINEHIWRFVEARPTSRGRSGRQRNQDINITLCGHSLGGALAQLFSVCRNEHHYGSSLIRATYTFGAPRIGKGEAFRLITRPHYRLIVRGDPVPQTPPLFTDDFEASFLDRQGRYSEPGNTFGQIGKAVKTMLMKNSLDFGSHDIEEYIHSIEDKIQAAQAKSTPRGP